MLLHAPPQSSLIEQQRTIHVVKRALARNGSGNANRASLARCRSAHAGCAELRHPFGDACWLALILCHHCEATWRTTRGSPRGRACGCGGSTSCSRPSQDTRTAVDARTSTSVARAMEVCRKCAEVRRIGLFEGNVCVQRAPAALSTKGQAGPKGQAQPPYRFERSTSS